MTKQVLYRVNGNAFFESPRGTGGSQGVEVQLLRELKFPHVFLDPLGHVLITETFSPSQLQKSNRQVLRIIADESLALRFKVA